MECASSVINRTCNGSPWRKNLEFSEDALEGLSQEIKQFSALMSPTVHEHEFRSSVIKKIRNVVKIVWPSVEMSVYGSFSTLLYTPSSDIDIVLNGIRPVDNRNVPDHNEVQKFYDALIKASICNLEDIQWIDRASVPIIKVESKILDLKFDFSFNLGNVVQSVKLVENMCQKLPFYKSLTMVVKQFMRQRNLNKVYKGGISSYSLSLMCGSFLCKKIKDMNAEEYLNNMEHMPGEIEKMILDKHNLGDLLIQFFDFFSTFDYDVYAIAWDTYPKIVPRESINYDVNDSSSNLLMIQDPLKPEKNVARGSFNLTLMIEAFEKASTKLKAAISRKFNANKVSILGEIIYIPDEFVNNRSLLQEKYKEMLKTLFNTSCDNIPVPQVPMCNGHFYHYNGFVNASPTFIPQPMVNVYPVHMGGYHFHEEVDYILNSIPSVIPEPMLNFNPQPYLLCDPRLNRLPQLLPPTMPLSSPPGRTRRRNCNNTRNNNNNPQK